MEVSQNCQSSVDCASVGESGSIWEVYNLSFSTPGCITNLSVSLFLVWPGGVLQ